MNKTKRGWLQLRALKVMGKRLRRRQARRRALGRTKASAPTSRLRAPVASKS